MRTDTKLGLSALVLIVAACSSMTLDPYQRVVNTTADTCKNVKNSLVALDGLVLSKSISKSAATSAAQALGTAQTGCEAALVTLQTNAPAPAASGAK